MEALSNTIYDKKIDSICIELENKASLEISAMMNITGNVNSSNIKILYSESGMENETVSVVIDSSDAYDLVDYIQKANAYDEDNTLNAKTGIGYGQTVEDDIAISKIYDDIVLYGTYIGVEKVDFDNPDQEKKEMHYEMYIPCNDVQEVLEALIEAIDVAEDILKANENLKKVMNKMKMEMKDNKIEELHFDIYDNDPDPFDKDALIKIRTISITPYGYDKQPLYTFLRYMYLTGNPKIDYRDNAKEFLMCPFVYSEKLLEVGKDFMKRKQGDLDAFVKERYSK